MLTVLSLDPGGTTGYCVSHIVDDIIRCGYKQAVWNEDDLFFFMTDLKPDKVVYESFQYRAGGMRQKGILRPSELIGVVRLYAQLNLGDNCLFPQGSSKAVGKDAFFTDKRLKDMDLYRPGKEHGRVAFKHFLYWVKFGGGSQFVDRNNIDIALV